MSALGRGLSAAGYAAGDLYGKGALMDAQSEQEMNRALRLAEFKEQMDIRGEKRGIDNRTAERGLMFAESVERAPQLRDIKAADRKAEKLSEYDSEVTDARLSAEDKAARQKAKVEREELIAAGTDPNYLKAKRNLAQATHIEGLGSVAQAELAKLGIEEKRKVATLIDEFETTDNPERKAKIKESLTVRGIIKPGEFDTEKVSTEVMNPDGSTTKTERTQKRRPDGSAGPAAKQDVRVAGQVIGQAASPEEAQALVAKWKAGKTDAPKKAAPIVGGQSGSHAPSAADESSARQVRAQIVEKRSRAALQGIDPEVRAQLLLEVRELEDRLNGKSALR